MDLLGKYNAPRPSEEIDLGQGFSIRRTRRPRARRRQGGAKPYDAREVYLQDQGDGPPARWRLASILVGLFEAVQKPPPADTEQAFERMAHIDELIRLVGGRGLNFETQVLPTLRDRIATAVITHVLLVDVNPATSPVPEPMGSWSSWVDSNFGKAAPAEPPEAQGERFVSILSSIMDWAHTVDTQALLHWFPPVDPPTTESSPSRPKDDDGVWIVSRFTETYLRQWPPQALRKEWLYLHGQHSPPCSPLEMNAREVPEADLAKQMADRFAEHPSSQREPSPKRKPAQLAHMLVSPAVDFLNEGRRVEAAALLRRQHTTTQTILTH